MIVLIVFDVRAAPSKCSFTLCLLFFKKGFLDLSAVAPISGEVFSTGFNLFLSKLIHEVLAFFRLFTHW